MPKAYAVVTYRSVSDPEKLAAYAKLAGPPVAPFGARFLARGNATVARVNKTALNLAYYLPEVRRAVRSQREWEARSSALTKLH